MYKDDPEELLMFRAVGGPFDRSFLRLTPPGNTAPFQLRGWYGSYAGGVTLCHINQPSQLPVWNEVLETFWINEENPNG